jgi:3-phenylpropionate/trans-cinnamate dioxygenase ferredoxin reductase subunit
MTDHIVIIGAGQAGVQAVSSLRAEGFSGRITLVGDEPFAPYQRPPLSKAYLLGDMVRERLFLKPDAFYGEAGVDMRLSTRAMKLDPGARLVTLADGAALSYDKLLLATGTRVRAITVPGADLPGVHYLRGIEDVDGLRPEMKEGARLAVIGGGYIGLEVAAVAAKRGLDVTVIETAPRVMARAVSPQMSAFYEVEHKAKGVKLLLNASAQAFEGSARVEGVVTNAGRVACDFALVGIGVLPNEELAKDAGLACDNGIVVDEYTQTSDANIFAAGDCTNHPGFYGERYRLESVQNAIDQAKHVALAMLGRKKRYREAPWFWSDQYDLKLQMAGLAKPGDEIVLRGDPASRKFSVFHVRNGVVAAVEAVNSAPDYIVGRKLIAEGKSVPAATLADSTILMKSLV